MSDAGWSATRSREGGERSLWVQDGSEMVNKKGIEKENAKEKK